MADLGTKRRKSFLPTSSVGGELSAYEPSYRENLVSLIADAGRFFGLGNYDAQKLGGDIVSLAEFSPLGLLTSYDEAQRAASRGDLAATMLAALGAVPGIGKGGKVAQKAADLAELSKATSALFSEGVTPGAPQRALQRYEPPRGVPPRVRDITRNPEARRGVLAAIERGKELGAQDWYNLEPLRRAFVDKFGDAEGAQRFNRLVEYMAGSSPRSSVPENVRNASYYYGLDVTGQPLQAPRAVIDKGKPKVIKNPPPYGHLAQDLHRLNFDRIRSGAGFDLWKNPKLQSFAANLQGNWRPATVDTHAFRLPAILAGDPRFLATRYQAGTGAPVRNIRREVESGALSLEEALRTPAYWQSKPNKTEYSAMERFYQDVARETGLWPAEAQAAAWVGGGPVTGLVSHGANTAMGFVKDRIALTAQKLRMDPRDVLAGMMRGTTPLLSLGGLATLPTLLPHRPEEDRKAGRI